MSYIQAVDSGDLKAYIMSVESGAGGVLASDNIFTGTNEFQADTTMGNVYVDNLYYSTPISGNYTTIDTIVSPLQVGYQLAIANANTFPVAATLTTFTTFLLEAGIYYVQLDFTTAAASSGTITCGLYDPSNNQLSSKTVQASSNISVSCMITALTLGTYSLQASSATTTPTITGIATNKLTRMG
jgi:hypothetical protein